MLYIPPTSQQCYISSIVALNIHSPEGTGDWHSAAALNDNAFPLDFYLYGKGQKYNTNALLGNLGIIDGTKRLNDMGYYPENTPSSSRLRGLSLLCCAKNRKFRTCNAR